MHETVWLRGGVDVTFLCQKCMPNAYLLSDCLSMLTLVNAYSFFLYVGETYKDCLFLECLACFFVSISPRFIIASLLEESAERE